jgi:hypothetical protein
MTPLRWTELDKSDFLIGWSDGAMPEIRLQPGRPQNRCNHLFTILF